MGLRCLLGHEYANREVEREREERGNEVVVTYRTVETCDRCGERRVVSENKEVRPVRNPAEDEVTTGLGGDGSGGGSVTPDLGGADDAPATDAGNDEVQEPESESESEPQPELESEPQPELESEPDPETADPAGANPEPASESTSDPATDDGDDPEAGTDDGGIILDDGPEDEGESDRRPGEWPEASDSEPDDDGTTVVSGDEGWPEPAGEDEGFDAEPSDGEPTDVSFGGGMTPERVDGAANGGAETAAATNGTAGGSVGGKQFVAAETVEHVGDESDGETEFFCPNCGHARDAGGSSMRAGDICPDCHKGYIAERER